MQISIKRISFIAAAAFHILPAAAQAQKTYQQRVNEALGKINSVLQAPVSTPELRKECVDALGVLRDIRAEIHGVIYTDWAMAALGNEIKKGIEKSEHQFKCRDDRFVQPFSNAAGLTPH